MKFRFDASNALLVVLSAVVVASAITASLRVPLEVRLAAGLAGVAAIGIAALTVTHGMIGDGRRLLVFARRRGWVVYDTEEGLADRFSVYPFGPGGRVSNVLRGTHRFSDAATFTYLAFRPAPQLFQVTMLELGVRTPKLQILPEDAIASVHKFFGGRDVKVGDLTIDTAWRIDTADQGFAREFVDRKLLGVLDLHESRGIPLAVEDGAILTWVPGARGVLRVSRTLDLLVEAAECLPEWMWKGGRGE